MRVCRTSFHPGVCRSQLLPAIIVRAIRTKQISLVVSVMVQLPTKLRNTWGGLGLKLSAIQVGKWRPSMLSDEQQYQT